MSIQEGVSREGQRDIFIRFANGAARWTGKPAVFLSALSIVVIWALSGPVFEYSDTWQLVINTGTTIITFLMVFLIQNTQNRDSYAVQLKLDELIRAKRSAHTELLDIEELSEDELCKLRDEYEELARKAREKKHKAAASGKKPAGGTRKIH